MLKITSTTQKLARHGNSTGLVLPKDILEAAGLTRGDLVAITAGTDGRIEIRRADETYQKAMAAGRATAVRYRQTLRKLAQ